MIQTNMLDLSRLHITFRLKLTLFGCQFHRDFENKHLLLNLEASRFH